MCACAQVHHTFKCPLVWTLLHSEILYLRVGEVGRNIDIFLSYKCQVSILNSSVFSWINSTHGDMCGSNYIRSFRVVPSSLWFSVLDLTECMVHRALLSVLDLAG